MVLRVEDQTPLSHRPMVKHPPLAAKFTAKTAAETFEGVFAEFFASESEKIAADAM